MSAVLRSMRMLNEEYPGKFSLGTVPVDKKGKPVEGATPSRVKVWEHALAEFDDETVLAAALHLVTTRTEWPPDVAAMRSQCALFSNGELHAPSGAASWERILQKISKKEVDLSDMEKKALSQTKSVFDLRISKNIDADRARYIQAFDLLISKRNLEWVTLPEVKALVAKNAPPALPAPKQEDQLPPKEDEPEIMTFAEAKKIFPEAAALKGVVEKIGE